MKSKGPKMEPCGTPKSTRCVSDCENDYVGNKTLT